MKKCVFAGSFDPPTTGHEAVIRVCLETFDEVVVAVMINPDKTPLLTAEQREKMLGKMYADEPRVKVRTFSGAAVDLLKEENTKFYVRGVRDGIDLAYENRNLHASAKLMPELITLYVPAPNEVGFVSSSLVRTSVRMNKDYESYIPEKIKQDLQEILLCLKDR